LNQLLMCDTPLRKMRSESYSTAKVTFFRRFLCTGRLTARAFILSLILGTSLQAQELVRTAAEEPKIESFRRSPEAFFYMGPFQEELGGSLSVEYNDNVNLTQTDRISDLSVIGALNLNTTWVITHLNQIQFNFGGQLIDNFYSTGRDQFNFAVSPDSKIEFKFEVSDFKVSLYDKFSYVQNPTTSPTATNTANLNSLTNTIGAIVDDDLGLAILSFSTDYTYNNQSGQNVQGQTNPTQSGTRETFRVGSGLTFRYSPTILYGLHAEASFTTAVDLPNVNTFNVGPFVNGKLSRDFEFDLAAGLTFIQTTPSVPTGYYFSAALRYQINRHWQLLLSGAHDLVFTVGTSLTEENVFKLGTEFGITRWVTFSAAPFVNFGDVKTSSVGFPESQGNYNQFGVEASLTWKPRKRWSTSLTYDYTRRQSPSTAGTGTTASQNYIQNTLTLSLNYAF
jgi:hypothetical protein